MVMKIRVGRRLLKIRKLDCCGRFPKLIRRVVCCIRRKVCYSRSLSLSRSKFIPCLEYPRVVGSPIYSHGPAHRTRSRDQFLQASNFFRRECKDAEKKGGHVNHVRRKVVPQGFVAIYVGEEQKRFVIPLVYLHHPFITRLLMEAETVFGYVANGPLRIPCDVDDFEQVKWLIDREKKPSSLCK
eukprot:Gb_31882 [translate_table: standard]